MAIEFHEGLETLKSIVNAAEPSGEWSEDTTGKVTFKTKDKGLLNYWPHKGTVQIQGKAGPKKRLEAIFADGAAHPTGPESNGAAGNPTKIFVVHGHDKNALMQLELVLRRLGLDPFILQNNDGETKTLIEALEQQIYKESAFGIVLLTPDDYGYPKSKDDAERQPRARQNVILEAGMVLASLGRSRMALLKKGALELPSDLDGLIRIEFNEDVMEVAVKLATRMKNAGIVIDDSLIHKAGM